MKEITQKDLVRIFKDNYENKSDTRFVFLLGAGASVQSGISSANKLAFTCHFHILNDHQNNLSHFFSGVKCNAAPPLAFSFKTSLSPAFIFL